MTAAVERRVQLSTLSYAFEAIAEEMGVNLVRSSFSSVVREARDCSTAILSPDGELVAVAALIPMQTAALSVAFAAVRETVGLSRLTQGTAVLLNDPAHGGQHLNDIIIIQPAVENGELIGFVGSTAHHIDIGGATAGINVEARELIQEGLVLPPLVIDVARDWFDGPFQRLIQANVRMADVVIGDINAQFAANRIGIARLQALAARHGREAVHDAMGIVISNGEARMRAALRSLPRGTYCGRARSDMINGAAIEVTVRATVGEGMVHLDFQGTSSQRHDMMNCPLASSMSAAICALRAIVGVPDLPVNGGCNRTVTAAFPRGSVINPTSGAPVRARATAAYRIFDAILDAFAPIVPERIPAQAFNTTFAMYLAHATDTGVGVHVDIFGGGFGAAHDYDGANAVDCVMSNCRATPVEAVEFAHPHLLVQSFALEPDSGGGGRWRGGLGFHRRIEVREPGVTLTWYADQFIEAPSGREGGDNGAPGAMRVRRRGDVLSLPAVGRVELEAGDVVEMRMGGGGGWGNATKRADAARNRDIRDGYVYAPDKASSRSESG